MSGLAAFFIVIGIVAVLVALGWVVYTQIRARRLGLPPPSLNPFADRNRSSLYPTPAPGGVVGWFNDKMHKLKQLGSGGGHRGSRGGRGRGRHAQLDPDEAWDTRVGNEADDYEPGGYYEEQELGLQSTPYAGGGYGRGADGGIDTRGRTRGRPNELDGRYGEEAGNSPRSKNPFGDHAEQSDLPLRGVSPRPVESLTKAHQQHKSQSSLNNDSPTDRRSMFREDM